MAHATQELRVIDVDGVICLITEERKGLKTSPIEKVAYRMGYVDAEKLEKELHDLY